PGSCTAPDPPGRSAARRCHRDSARHRPACRSSAVRARRTSIYRKELQHVCISLTVPPNQEQRIQALRTATRHDGAACRLSWVCSELSTIKKKEVKGRC